MHFTPGFLLKQICNDTRKIEFIQKYSCQKKKFQEQDHALLKKWKHDVSKSIYVDYI